MEQPNEEDDLGEVKGSWFLAKAMQLKNPQEAALMMAMMVEIVLHLAGQDADIGKLADEVYEKLPEDVLRRHLVLEPDEGPPNQSVSIKLLERGRPH